MEDLIEILKEEFKPQGYKVPSMKVNACLFNLFAICDKQARLLKPFFGRMIKFSNELSIEELGISYTDIKKTMIDMAYDLIEKKVVPDKRKKKK